MFLKNILYDSKVDFLIRSQTENFALTVLNKNTEGSIYLIQVVSFVESPPTCMS